MDMDIIISCTYMYMYVNNFFFKIEIKHNEQAKKKEATFIV